MSSLLIARRGEEWTWRSSNAEPSWSNGIESWVHAMNGGYAPVDGISPERLREHDLVMLNLDYPILHRLDHVLKFPRRDSQAVVGLVEGGINDIRNHVSYWRRVADRCDLIAAINPLTLDELRRVTETPVEYIGIPYPYHEVEKFASSHRRDAVLICGRDEQALRNHAVASGLDLNLIALAPRLQRRIRSILKAKSLRRNIYGRRLQRHVQNSRLQVEYERPLDEFYRFASALSLWIDLDERYTWGRYVLDAAALGVPVVTSRETGHSERLFGELTVAGADRLAEARDLVKRLQEDSALVNRAVSAARNNLPFYSPGRTVKRLHDALESLRN